MNFLEFSYHQDNDISSFNVTRSGKNESAGIYIPTKFESDEYLSTTALSASLLYLIEKSPALLKPLSEDGWKDRAVKEMVNVANEIKGLQKGAIGRAVELDKRYQGWLNPKTIDNSHMAEIRSYMRGLKPSEAIRKATQDGVIANAVVQNPHGIAGMDDELLFSHVERAAIEHNFSQTYASQVIRKPVLDAIIAYGTDNEKVTKYVKEALNNFEKSKSDISTIEKVLNQAVNFYAVAADINRDQAFEAINLGGVI